MSAIRTYGYVFARSLPIRMRIRDFKEPMRPVNGTHPSRSPPPEGQLPLRRVPPIRRHNPVSWIKQERSESHAKSVWQSYESNRSSTEGLKRHVQADYVWLNGHSPNHHYPGCEVDLNRG